MLVMRPPLLSLPDSDSTSTDAPKKGGGKKPDGSPAERLSVLGRILRRRDTWLRDRAATAGFCCSGALGSAGRFGLDHGGVLSKSAAMICWSISCGVRG